MTDQDSLHDSFLKISFEEVNTKDVQQANEEHKHKDQAYAEWKEEHSHKATDPGLYFTNILRKKYPGKSVVRVLNPYAFPLQQYPEIVTRPIPDQTMDNAVVAFLPFARSSGRTGGVILETVKFGGFLAAWKDWDFLIFFAMFPSGLGSEQDMWIVHEGSEEPIYNMLHASATWLQELHGEVLVYNQGFWRKDAALYQEIQKARWEDVILKQEFKTAIQGDIENFFKSQAVYKELGVPWKRGLIFHGPAGNGKTISLKAAMHGTTNPILYVRTFTNWAGDEAAMADIFGMARRFSPCMLIIEDIDSHINERNRSFFLNELDGLDNNDGILLIATTNHLERLDNSIANRPSRFDRKYLFDDPDEEERRLYCRYWQNKLKNNKKVSFPDDVADEIAKMSGGLSFAYLKEAFVSTLILMAGDDAVDFVKTLKSQIKELLDQIKKPSPGFAGPIVITPPTRSIKVLLGTISVVNSTFVPSLPDELSIAVGDQVRVISVHNDGWAWCEKVVGGETGLIPQECLKSVTSSNSNSVRPHLQACDCLAQQPLPSQAPNFRRQEETGALGELLQRLTKTETRQGLSVQSIIPTSDTPLRRWI